MYKTLVVEDERLELSRTSHLFLRLARLPFRQSSIGSREGFLAEDYRFFKEVILHFVLLMEAPQGFEPWTHRLTVCCANQLR